MCGRYTLTVTDPADLAARFGARAVPTEALGRWNVAPTEAMALVTRDGAAAARWGLLPRWARDLSARPQPINARAETAAGKPAFAHAVPCLVLADGWYEWLRAEDRRRVSPAPVRYTVDAGQPFAMAGVVATHTIAGRAVRSAAILTCAANAVCAPVHDRMPVVLAGPDEEAAWIAGETIEPELCRPLDPGRVSARPVSARVNRAGTGDEGIWLLEADVPAAPPAPAQASLF